MTLKEKIKSDLQKASINVVSFSFREQGKIRTLQRIVGAIETVETDEQVLEVLEQLKNAELQKETISSSALWTIGQYTPPLTESEIEGWMSKNVNWIRDHYDLSNPVDWKNCVESIDRLITHDTGKEIDKPVIEKLLIKFKEITNLRVFEDTLSELLYKLKLFKSENDMIQDFQYTLDDFLEKWQLK